MTDMTAVDRRLEQLIDRRIEEKIVLVGVSMPPNTMEDAEAGLDELAQLIDTAGAVERGCLQRMFRYCTSRRSIHG